jgi:molecular chaperone DnaK (HSP70)
MTTGLVIDLGTVSVAAIVVTDRAAWLIPDPASGASRWRCSLHWDGDQITVGAQADHRAVTDPAGYAANVKSGLDHDQPVRLGARTFRPFEQVMELLSAIRGQAQRHHGPIERVLLTIPAGYLPHDPRRSRLVAAAETAGFTAVELLAEAVAAVSAPMVGPPFGDGALVLVYDLGATFEATLVRMGDDYHEVYGHAAISDPASRPTVDDGLACARDLLAGLGLEPAALTAVLPVGGGCRAAGVAEVLERGLGAPVRRVEEPELLVVRGAAHWLPRSSPRTVEAQRSPDRIVPLSFTIPGGSARLLSWLVAAHQPYEEGVTLARIRLAGGAVWDLTARTRGTLDEVLVGAGATVTTGEWLALARP